MTTPLYRIRDKKNKRYEEDYYVSNCGEYFVYKCYEREFESVGKDYIIERCTGMQDVKGKRMFENDIVTCGLDYKDIKYTLILEGMQRKIYDGYYLKFATDGKDLEVIGNTHQ